MYGKNLSKVQSSSWVSSALPDDVELISFSFDGCELGDHGQVSDLNSGPAELEEADENDEEGQVARRRRSLAKTHAAGEHERERHQNTDRTFIQKSG